MPHDSTPHVGGSLDQIEDRLTACEVLHWIAFGELKTLEQLLQDECSVSARWGHAFGDEFLEALEARISLNPYCPVYRLEGDITVTRDGVDVSNDRMGHYQHPAYSPQGPRYLRHMRATVRRRRVRLVSYRDIVVELREELARSKSHMKALDAAGIELIKKVRANKVRAIGQRNIRGESPQAGADYVPIPSETFEHPAIKITVWNAVTLDVNRPYDEWRGFQTSFSNVRFPTAEVIAIWRPPQPLNDALSATGDPARRLQRAAYKPQLEGFIDQLPADNALSDDAVAGQFMAHVDGLRARGELVQPRLPQRRNIEIQVAKLRRKVTARRARPPISGG
jgi:hypothetical protein